MKRPAAVPIAVSAAPAPAAPTGAAPFPPQEITAFLACCAGEWLALRSCFQLESLAETPAAAELAEPAAAEQWHSSGRGELRITYAGPQQATEAGRLTIHPPEGAPQQLLFHHDQTGADCRGTFSSGSGQGTWQLWPDGSLDLRIDQGPSQRQERIWFTKPNLRLRSTIEQGEDGRPARASFSSEIRRLPRPEPQDD